MQFIANKLELSQIIKNIFSAILEIYNSKFSLRVS